MLLLRNSNPAANQLTGVGGHIEEKERASTCAHRELQEEAGFDTELKHIGVMPSISSHIYFGKIEKIPFDVKNMNEGVIKWFSKEEALNSLSISRQAKAILKYYWR